MQGVDRPQRAGVGLPVQMAEGQPGDQARGEQLVHAIGIVVLDCAKTARESSRGPEREGGLRLPVTLDVEKGCSIASSEAQQLASCHSYLSAELPGVVYFLHCDKRMLQHCPGRGLD